MTADDIDVRDEDDSEARFRPPWRTMEYFWWSLVLGAVAGIFIWLGLVTQHLWVLWVGAVLASISSLWLWIAVIARAVLVALREWHAESTDG